MKQVRGENDFGLQAKQMGFMMVGNVKYFMPYVLHNYADKTYRFNRDGVMCPLRIRFFKGPYQVSFEHAEGFEEAKKTRVATKLHSFTGFVDTDHGWLEGAGASEAAKKVPAAFVKHPMSDEDTIPDMQPIPDTIDTIPDQPKQPLNGEDSDFEEWDVDKVEQARDQFNKLQPDSIMESVIQTTVAKPLAERLIDRACEVEPANADHLRLEVQRLQTIIAKAQPVLSVPKVGRRKRSVPIKNLQLKKGKKLQPIVSDTPGRECPTEPHEIAGGRASGYQSPTDPRVVRDLSGTGSTPAGIGSAQTGAPISCDLHGITGKHLSCRLQIFSQTPRHGIGGAFSQNPHPSS